MVKKNSLAGKAVTVRLDPEVYNALSVIATIKGVSAASICEEALAEYLPKCNVVLPKLLRRATGS